MTRSDGTFPRYAKVELDPQKPVVGWKEGSRRCAICKKNWPNISAFSPSPCCNANAGIVAGGIPDMTWPDAVKAYLTRRFEKLYEVWNEGKTDEELLWTPDASHYSEDSFQEGMDEIESLINESARS